MMWLFCYQLFKHCVSHKNSDLFSGGAINHQEYQIPAYIYNIISHSMCIFNFIPCINHIMDDWVGVDLFHMKNKNIIVFIMILK